MGAFIKKYDMVLDCNIINAMEIFNDNFDDMSKKGYSLSGNTLIYNSDHKSKYFSGIYKNDCYFVRQTDSGTDDFYYRLLPKHTISFESLDNDRTVINVKSKSSFGIIMFLIFLFIELFILLILITDVFLADGNKLYALIALIPVGAMLVTALTTNHSLCDTKETLEYIYRK